MEPPPAAKKFLTEPDDFVDVSRGSPRPHWKVTHLSRYGLGLCSLASSIQPMEMPQRLWRRGWRLPLGKNVSTEPA
jgi:hypothetical protein